MRSQFSRRQRERAPMLIGQPLCFQRSSFSREQLGFVIVGTSRRVGKQSGQAISLILEAPHFFGGSRTRNQLPLQCGNVQRNTISNDTQLGGMKFIRPQSELS